MKKFIIIVLLIFWLPVHAEVGFSDVSEVDWYFDYVSNLIEANITSGYGDGTFRPNNEISVEEFITMTIKSIGETEADIEKFNWSDGFIHRAKTLNIVLDNEFGDYTKPITRGEMGRIVLRASDVVVPENYISYASAIKDLDTMDSYWQNIAVRVYSTGIITGYPNGNFGLDNHATRAEASVILSKLLDESLRTLPDIPVSDVEIRMSEINREWLLRKPVYDGDVYLSTPSSQAPYLAGTVDEAYLNDGLNMLKFLRFLSYLPYDNYLSDSANELAQHGAMLIGVSEFSHTPAKPDDMEDIFYEKAYNATSTGNLAAGVSSLSDAVKLLMDDADEFNIELIGHRRWQQLPQLKEVGMGFVETDNLYKYYTVIKVFNNLETEPFVYNNITWPSQTAFPIEFFGPEVPWSITLNPNLYDNKKTDDIVVEVRNRTTGLIWSFDKNDKALDGEYFNVDTAGYGVPFCIIFRPDPKTFNQYDLMTTYEVTVKNLYTTNGAMTQVEYETTFFNIKE